jgi:adenylate cyclase
MNLYDLFTELKRRRVFRVTGIYAIVAWIVVQVAATTFPVLMLPEWTVRFVVALFLLGLPVVVVLAWLFDITPEGIERTGGSHAGGSESAARGAPAALAGSAAGGEVRRSRRLPAWALPMLLVAAAATGFYHFAPLELAQQRAASPAAADDALDRSLAVLPFADFSPGGDQEWFSDGLTEELLNALAQVPGLRVAARTSSFTFKGQNVAIDEVARRLNVSHVLEGSVRRSGDRVRITAQLVAAATGYHLWSQTYDRRTEDIFDIQEEISRAIAAELRGRLGLEVRVATLPARMTDAETYDLYLRGRFHWWSGTLADLEQALDFFHRAVARDSSFALAWVGLADTYMRLAQWGHRPPREVFPSARAAVQRAVELDSLLPPARATLAKTLRWWDHDRIGARHEFLRALELNPHDAPAHEGYGWLLADEGRLDEAIEHFRRAVELDPLSFTAASQLGVMFRFAGRWEDAIPQFERAVRLANQRGFSGAWAYSMYRLGRGEEAIAVLEAGQDPNVFRTAALGYLYAATGRTADARRILAEFRRQAQHQYVPAHVLAAIHMALGEHDAALDELERAWHQGSLPPELNVSAEYTPLHGHPRYRMLLRKLGLETGRGEIP